MTIDATWPAPSGARLALPAAARADLAAIRAHVGTSLGTCLGDGARDGMVLAADEVCANVVTHAYGDARGPLTVDVDAGESAAVVTIIDAGPPFDPRHPPHRPDTSASAEQRPIGGLGLHLVMQSVDELRYARRGCYNVVMLATHTGPASRARS